MSAVADSIPMMRKLAKTANMELSQIKRMVLVLDVNDVPTLFVETFLDAEVEFDSVEFKVVEGPLPAVIDTTSMQNEVFRTHQEVKDKG